MAASPSERPTPPDRPRAVLFDVDGTLLDTRDFILGGFEHALATHGHAARTRAELAAVVGRTLHEGYPLVAPGCDPPRMIETHRAWQRENLHLALPFPDTVPTLAALHAAGLRLAAVTTRSRVTSLDTLRLAGIDGYFDVVISWEDITHPKPHPEPVQRALERLSVAPEHALMVGDTDADILAGRAAGTRTAGVTYGFHEARIADAAPDWLLDRLADLLPICLGDAHHA